MLQHISIKHYALIESLEISLGTGLNILTGETGSGKSIILGALGLMLGDRAETRVVQEGKPKCIVEGTFLMDGLGLEPLFAENDLDFFPSTTIRREISAAGVSRAFVNDTPVNLKVLREISLRLIDIHSQHQTLQINDHNFQLDTLDRYAGAAKERAAYAKCFANYSRTQKALDEAHEYERLLRKDREFTEFQLRELEAAGLDSIDEAAMEEEFNMLTNAEEISARLQTALMLLSEGNEPATTNLRLARDGMDALSGYSKTYAELAERLRSVLIETDDIASEIDRLSSKVESDPGRLAELNEVRNSLFKLEQKHGISGLAALIELRENLRAKLKSSDNAAEEIDKLQKQLSEQQKELIAAGELLRKVRKAGQAKFPGEIEKILRSLSMEQARFEVYLEPAEKPTATGLDKIQMLFSANAGKKPEILRLVASGGELSRLMLAVKKITAEASPRTTIVFDEIDTGVSGEVAHAMGNIMRQMARGLQVLCITHLPQIAAKGEFHYKVFKLTDNGVARTDIAALNANDRIVEIAQMLSGAKTSDAALANAKELLGVN
jgi:DNA repair protein RecN (Recombination protein N)